MVKGYLVFLKHLLKAFGGARARVLPSWQVTFKMRCRGLQRTAWSRAWQAIDWKLTPGQLLIAVGNNPPPQPTICCLRTEGTVQGSTPGGTKRAYHLVPLMEGEDNREWGDREGPQRPELLAFK